MFRLFLFIVLITGLLQGQELVDSTQQLQIKMDPELNEWLNSLKNCDAPIVLDTPTDPCESKVLVDGIKIQLMYSQNIQQAEQALAESLSLFPKLSPVLSYDQPDYKVQIGEYLSQTDAANDLKKARTEFPAALLVKGKVRCRSAMIQKTIDK